MSKNVKLIDKSRDIHESILEKKRKKIEDQDKFRDEQIQRCKELGIDPNDNFNVSPLTLFICLIIILVLISCFIYL